MNMIYLDRGETNTSEDPVAGPEVGVQRLKRNVEDVVEIRSRCVLVNWADVGVACGAEDRLLVALVALHWPDLDPRHFVPEVGYRLAGLAPASGGLELGKAPCALVV